MTFQRSFMNWTEGVGVCIWDAPSKEAIEKLFKDEGTPFERIVEVEEHVSHSLVT